MASQPERPGHRQGHRHRRHRLHLAHRRHHARDLACAAGLVDSGRLFLGPGSHGARPRSASPRVPQGHVAVHARRQPVRRRNPDHARYERRSADPDAGLDGPDVPGDCAHDGHRRNHHGPARRRRAFLAGLGVGGRARGHRHGFRPLSATAVSRDARARGRHQRRRARADHGHPGGARVRPGALRGGPIPPGQPADHGHLGGSRCDLRPDAPGDHDGVARRHRRGAVVRRSPRQCRPHRGRLPNRVHAVPAADPLRRDHVRLHRDGDPARRGLRRTPHRALDRDLPDDLPAGGHASHADSRTRRIRRCHLRIPRRGIAGHQERQLRGRARPDNSDHRLHGSRQVHAAESGPAALRPARGHRHDRRHPGGGTDPRPTRPDDLAGPPASLPL